MSRALKVIFLGLALKGITLGMYGAAVLAGLMVGLLRFADRRFAAQDKLYNADPCNVKHVGPSTSDAMTAHDCECMRSKF